MPLLQLLAARLAAVDRLVFHAVSADGVRSFRKAETIARDTLKSAAGALEVSRLLATIQTMGFTWGVSDGN